MSQIKELLEKALDCAKDKNIKRLDSIDAGQTYKWIMQDMFALIDQAIAKLQEQPPAGEYPDSEFTKIQRLAIESCEASYEGNEWLPIGLQRLAEACARLDRSEASRKELLDACRELVKFCYPDGKWRGWDNMKGILEIMQPIRRLENE